MRPDAGTTTDCDATHVADGGVRCEMPAGHRGLHRHGQFTGRIRFGSDTRGLCRRAERVAEWARLDAGYRVAATAVANGETSIRIWIGAARRRIERAVLVYETLDPEQEPR